jgi:putative component of toxin-antitoxin plasmid stabilization module
LYYTVRDRVVVFMLAGGLKRTQKRDIDRPKTLEQAL